MADEAKTEDRSYTIDDLKGRTPDEIMEIINVTKAQIRDLHQTDAGELRQLDQAEARAMSILLDVHEQAEAMYEEHRKLNAVLQRRPKAIEYRRLGHQDGEYVSAIRVPAREARDRALRVLDSRENSSHMSSDQLDEANRQIRESADIARRVLVTETEDYRSAWLKVVTHPRPFLSQEENRAMQAWEEYRNMSENTTTAGGFGIPVKLAA